jgi:hypothetical protein
MATDDTDMTAPVWRTIIHTVLPLDPPAAAPH